jgi:transposase InsO family protein
MGQVLHGSATTTEAVRRAIQNSQASLRALAQRHGINPKTVAKWKKRKTTTDHPTGPRHPWTNGQVERMNRTLKDATVRRYYYDTHDQLRGHLGDFLRAYNFARRLKTLRGLTPYESICKIWTTEPQRFRLDPLHQMPGLNI